MLSWLSALLILPVRDQRGLVWRSILSALLILFASGAKENGVLGIGLVALHQLFFAASPARSRFRQAVIASAFATGGVAIYLVARFVVIGGTGGYQTTGVSLASWWTNTRGHSMDFIEAVLCPWNFLPLGSPARAASVSLLILTVLSVLAVASAGARRAKALPPHIGLLILGWAWAAANILFNGFAETFNQRYVMLPTAGIALALAALAHWAILLFGRASWPAGEQATRFGYAPKFAALVSFPSLAGIVALSLQSSPLFVDYWEWPEASRRESEYLTVLDDVVRSAAPGTRIDAPQLPYIPETPGRDRPRLRIPAVLADYSIQAWAELHAPTRKVRVVSASVPEISPPEADEVLLIVRDQPAIIDRFRTQSRPGPIDRR
jgi:hypothetical protein